MASVVGICNSALVKLGANTIVSITQNTPSARACNEAYERLRDAELRSHVWNFAIKRKSLAAAATAPEWGRANSYPLPSDWLRMADPYPEDVFPGRDWVIEGLNLLTNDGAPLHIRYVSRVTDPNLMDPLFREALACRMAGDMAELLTQSNTKKSNILQDYTGVLREARRTNALEVVPAAPPEDSFIYMRR